MKKVLKIISLVLIIIIIFIVYLIILKSIRIKILEKNAEIKVYVWPTSMYEDNLNNTKQCYFLDIDHRTLHRVDYYKTSFIKNYKIFKVEVSNQDIKNTIDIIEKNKNNEIRKSVRAVEIIAIYNDEEIYLKSLPFSY